jgi:hypothetical protein
VGSAPHAPGSRRRNTLGDALILVEISRTVGARSSARGLNSERAMNTNPWLRACLALSLPLCSVGCGGSVTPGDTPDGASATAADAPVIVDAVDARPLGTCDTNPVAEIPSRQSVRFHFAIGAPVFLVTRGQYCGSLAIDRVDTVSTPVTLALPFQCVCECAQPAVDAQSFVSLHDAAVPPVVTWDARELHTCTRSVDCSAWARSGGGGPYQDVTEGVSQPVSAGHYRATFIVYDTLPSACHEDPDGTGSCSEPDLGWHFQPPPNYMLCWSPGMLRSIQVEFDLPASGDVDVMVPVM